MRILFPLEYFYPSLIDGKANTIYSLTKELSKSGLNINIISSLKGIKIEKVDVNNFTSII